MFSYLWFTEHTLPTFIPAIRLNLRILLGNQMRYLCYYDTFERYIIYFY